MCYIAYTNFQRQGAVANMTAEEVTKAEQKRDHYVIHVWDHKTAMAHGSAALCCPNRVYQLLVEYMGGKKGADLVFLTASGEKVTQENLL